MYNESEVVNAFHSNLLKEVLKATSDSYEIIYVNDGSIDNTLKLLREIAKKNTKVKVLNLSRNFGKEVATTAGISISSGDATILMDGDGQHPPSLIKEFIKKWQGGAQVVVGVRTSNTNEGFIKKWGSKMFYQIFNSFSSVKMVPKSTDYRLIDKSVRLEFMRFTERQRITRGLIDWLGFKRDFIEFEAPERMGGEASYKTHQLVKLAMNSFISLSLTPLFLFGWVGGFITFSSFLLGMFILIEQFILGDPLFVNFTGPAILSIFIAFLIGLVLMSQGIIAIYLSHVHGQTQQRPLFVIDRDNSSNIDGTARSI